MKIELDHLGRIAKDCPKTFYRVSTWGTDRRVADFTSEAEANSFAISDSGKGCVDHKVSTLHLS